VVVASAIGRADEWVGSSGAADAERDVAVERVVAIDVFAVSASSIWASSSSCSVPLSSFLITRRRHSSGAIYA